MAISANDTRHPSFRYPTIREACQPSGGLAASDQRSGTELACDHWRTSDRKSAPEHRGSAHAGRLDGVGARPFSGKLPDHWRSALTDLTPLDFLRSVRLPDEAPPVNGHILTTKTKLEDEILDCARRTADAQGGPAEDALRSVLRRQWAELDNKTIRPECRAILDTIKEADLLNR